MLYLEEFRDNSTREDGSGCTVWSGGSSGARISAVLGTSRAGSQAG